MNFQHHDKNSVQSLLALLRTTQDSPASQTAAPTPGTLPHYPPPSASTRPDPSVSGVPSQRQLNDLLHSLNSRGTAAAQTPSTSSLQAEDSQYSSAFGGARHNLIEPFGPVGRTSDPSRLPYDPQIRTTPPKTPPADKARSGSFGRSNSATKAEGTGSTTREVDAGKVKGKGKGRALPGDPEYGVMGFKDALPVLTELLAGDEFLQELRKMKVDQDTLERRLWAKQEKVKAEHERRIKAEKDIARIARKTIPPDKQLEWSQKLSGDLSTFHRQSCLPAIDGLAQRQRERLEALGVPGLAGEAGDPKARDRVRRIMDVLQAGMEEG
ncbi:hypothetical protein EHS25_005991 [Saitozyma podzolica]|uniref:Uncharacterized protein n=1 Tax=Saitozyma podzolica TaxID=1890683 RepID=A0A427XU66_9TREE|nr:hypothetical protein EHS25_005991 [Saitozyma podzolica]